MRGFTVAAMLVAAMLCPVSGSVGADPGIARPHWQSDLDRLVVVSGVPGAQLVVSGDFGEIQLNSGSGDLGTGAPFPDDAQVRIASNTKAFVAAVALQLVAEQRVDLDSPIDRYLPGVVTGPGGDGQLITVRNLLQHTSGIPDYLDQVDLDSVAGMRNYRPASELIRAALDRPAEFQPGARWGYSNTNYLIIGSMIERVTGLPVGVEVTRRIILPLGLQNTYWPLYPLEQVVRGPHPRNYLVNGTQRVDVTDIDPNWGLADGAMVATERDLNRYFMALVSGRVVPPAQLEQMRTTIPSGVPLIDQEIGLGLFRRVNRCGMETWGHGGTVTGSNVVGAATDRFAVTIAMNQLPTLAASLAPRGGIQDMLDTVMCDLAG
ncbi:serine hydrolase domain-containing protein [Nocardia xishanensis]|uniref:serine hydrolase domain-containing protein n=1 Tax=Nocardia xishanensis TaxID=238964 RepID=UPI00082D9B0C|nr:serine hydrolase domain-containing protein [Nocardia xishanensis]